MRAWPDHWHRQSRADARPGQADYRELHGSHHDAPSRVHSARLTRGSRGRVPPRREHGAFVHAHLGNGLASLTTLLGLSRDSGAPLHVAHINSTAGGDIQTYLTAVNAARARKVDVTTEVYPYTAGATLIQSALYESWETWPEERFGTLQWAATGERLTRATFAKYRAQGGSVIGAYADVAVFDPATVSDRSTYTNAAAYSEGILHVIVNGVPIVREGNLETHATLQGQRIAVGSRMPGRPIRAPRKP